MAIRVGGGEIQLDDVLDAFGVRRVWDRILHNERARVEAEKESPLAPIVVGEPAAHTLQDLTAPSVHHQRRTLECIGLTNRRFHQSQIC